MTRTALEHAMNKESITEIEQVFDNAFRHYPNLQRSWIAGRFDDSWRRPAEVIADYAAEFDRMIEEDRHKYLDDLAAQNQMLKL